MVRVFNGIPYHIILVGDTIGFWSEIGQGEAQVS